MRNAVRGLALALGVFALLSLWASWSRGAGDANLWWIDASFLPHWVAGPMILLGAFAMVLWGIRPHPGLIRRAFSLPPLIALLTVAVRNVMVYYQLLGAGAIRTTMPLPVSLLVAILIAVVLWHVAWPDDVDDPILQRWAGFLAGLAAFAILFPLAQVLLYGQTDYRRKADAIVVLGAKAYADGRPSQALADRVRTGAELYREGFAPLLIMSGGPGDGSVHETAAMQRLAMKLQVPRSAILRDEQGLNTAATVRNLQEIAKTRGLHKILAVSHSWHLPRIKLAASAADELTLYTVPCEETLTLAGTPYYIAREVVAFWKYYATEVLGQGATAAPSGP